MENVSFNSINKARLSSWSKPAKVALITIVALVVIGAIAASVIFTPVCGFLFSLAVWKFSLILSGSGAAIAGVIASVFAKSLSTKSSYISEKEQDMDSSGSVQAALGGSENEEPIARPAEYANHEHQIVIDVNRGLKLTIKLANCEPSLVGTTQIKESVASLYETAVRQFRAAGRETPEEDALKVLSFCHQGAFARDLGQNRNAVDGYEISALPKSSPDERLPRQISINITIDDLGNCSVHLTKEQPSRGEPIDGRSADKYFQISYSVHIPNIFATDIERRRTTTVVEPEDQSPVRE
jgi:hypothetical protein